MIKILKKKENIDTLSNNYIGHLGYIYKNEPFIAPITYYYSKDDNIIIGYSDQGHKITAMIKYDKVCLEVGEIEAIDNWTSVQVHGTFKQLSGCDSKLYLHMFSLGVKHLINEKENRNLNFISEFSSKLSISDTPVVFIIKIDEITGRMRIT